MLRILSIAILALTLAAPGIVRADDASSSEAEPVSVGGLRFHQPHQTSTVLL
jgi:hypothetical protein